MLNLRALVTGVPNQLRYVNRYSTSRVMHRENVAEHSFFTAFYSLLLCEELNDPDIDQALVLTSALLHDIDEHYTGDIIRPVKHGSEDLTRAINDLSASMVHSFFLRLLPESPQNLFGIWYKAKSEQKEGRIVAFADFLSVLSYLHQEVWGGNVLVMSNVEGLRNYIRKFETKDFEFLRLQIKEAGEIVTELIKIKEKLHGTKSDVTLMDSTANRDLVLHLDGKQRQQTRSKARGGKPK